MPGFIICQRVMGKTPLVDSFLKDSFPSYAWPSVGISGQALTYEEWLFEQVKSRFGIQIITGGRFDGQVMLLRRWVFFKREIDLYVFALNLRRLRQWARTMGVPDELEEEMVGHLRFQSLENWDWYQYVIRFARAVIFGIGNTSVPGDWLDRRPKIKKIKSKQKCPAYQKRPTLAPRSGSHYYSSGQLFQP